MSNYERILRKTLLDCGKASTVGRVVKSDGVPRTVSAATCMALIQGARIPTGEDALLLIELEKSGWIGGFHIRLMKSDWVLDSPPWEGACWSGFGMSRRWDWDMGDNDDFRKVLLSSWVSRGDFWNQTHCGEPAGETEYMMSLDGSGRLLSLEEMHAILGKDELVKRSSGGLFDYGIIFMDDLFLAKSVSLMGNPSESVLKRLPFVLAENFGSEHEELEGCVSACRMAEKLVELGCDFSKKNDDGLLPSEKTDSPSFRSFLEKLSFAGKFVEDAPFVRKRCMQP